MKKRNCKFGVIYCMVPDFKSAKKIATELLNTRQAACINILPKITSIYRWKGKVETGTELLLIIKTRTSLFKVVQKSILEIHPYELPEIIMLPIEAGLNDYLQWVKENT